MRKLSANPFITYGIDLFHEAERECELDGWKAEKTLLDLILLRVKTAGDINYLLDSFKNRQKIQTYLRKELLKRIFSHSIKLPTGINWNAVDAVLLSIADPEKRLSELKKILSMRPNDPEALRRLLYALLDLNQKDEALIIANKIRNLGFHSPQILEILGDLLAEKGDTVAAKKIYSEIVEHNPTDSDARRLLGDIFLRYGWYEDAYRQYSTLLLLSGTDPADMIRQALAASGAGRTDEGLRTLNRIIEMSLEPGKIAVRDWAKLWSAVKISRLMLSEKKDGEKLKALERTLKRTEVFGSPATLYILTWEDTSAKLVLKFKQGHDEFTATDIVDASPVCLTGSFINASQTGTGQNAIKPVPVVEWGNSGLKRSVKYEIVTIVWDGKQFTSDIMKSALDQVKPVVAK
jgi:tetratricopeptide (TPR) repeat protein